MFARVLPRVGSLALPVLIAILYLLPLSYWTLSSTLSEPVSLPSGLPFASLMLRTSLVSAISASLAVLSAFPLALHWRLSGYRMRRAFVFLMVTPLIMGLLARNYSWIGMLSSQTWLSSMGWISLGGASILYTLASVCLVMTCVFVPVAFFMMIQGICSVSLEHIDAARALGVPDWKIIFVVILPLTRRAALLAFAFIFAMASGFFITPRMIGGGKYDFISNAILLYVNLGSFGDASSVALTFFAIMLLPIAVIVCYAVRLRHLVMGT